MSYASDALIDSYRKENEALKEENARLQAEYDDIMNWDMLRRDIYQQEYQRRCTAVDENKKLRELVRDMFMTFCTFRETPMTDSEELKHSVRFWKRLSELGIEES